MRYGKVTQGDWTIEFQFNWRDNQYDVIAYEGPRVSTKKGIEGEKIGKVWKDPKRSRKRPSWAAKWVRGGQQGEMTEDFPQMREAGIALFSEYNKSDNIHP